ncbi:MAG: hypothetical protein P4L87_08380, partial [Formivibrio sp.]|nr:hypothetical protein [Formivibrio sp.]
MTLPSPGGLAADAYSVCVDFLAGTAGTYVSAGSGQLFVVSATSFSPLTVLSGAAGASTSVTITGLGLDAANSIRDVMFAIGTSCASPTVSAQSYANVGGSGSTKLSVALPSPGGLAAASYSVCVDITAGTVGSYTSVGSGQVFVASVTSFSPLTVLSGAAGASTSVTITGLGLDATNSIRAVKFSVGTSCASPTVSAQSFANVGGSGNTQLSVALPTGTGLSAATYSVCVDLLAGTAGTYVNAGSGELFVGSVTSFSPLTVLSGAAGASTSVTITGLGLDATNSIRAIKFAVGTSCASPTVTAQSYANVGGSGNTQMSVTLPSPGGLGADAYSVCVDFLAGTAGTYVSAGSGQLFVVSVTSFSPLTVLSGAAGASTSLTITGLGLDAVNSIR